MGIVQKPSVRFYFSKKHVLSTPGFSVVKRGKKIEMPVCVVGYNHNMGGVDLKDQLLNMYLVERKRMNNWYMKLLNWLLNSTVLNSIIIFRQAT